MTKKEVTLTQERLKEVLTYDEKSGAFTRKEASGNARIGTVAGFEHNGYTFIKIDGQRYKAARLAWLYIHGEFPACNVCYVKGKSDKIDNLRLAKIEKIPGIMWSAKKQQFNISIVFEGKTISVGYANTQEAGILLQRQGNVKYGLPPDNSISNFLMIKNICHDTNIVSRKTDPRSKPKDQHKRGKHGSNAERKLQPTIKVRRIINVPEDMSIDQILTIYRSTPDLHNLLLKQRHEIDFDSLGAKLD